MTKMQSMLFVLSAAFCILLSPISSEINVWPKPRTFSWPKQQAALLSPSFTITAPDHTYLSSAVIRYRQLVLTEHYAPVVSPSVNFTSSTPPLQTLFVTVADLAAPLHHGVNESYTLTVPISGPAKLTAETVWGAMRGLETFSQLVWGYPSRVAVGLYVWDAPLFAHRGVLLDTSRNYYPVEDILRTIRAMSANKLNVFHWHITDSHSFPLVLPSEPELAAKGSYGPNMQYYPDDVTRIVNFGLEHGIRVIPEIDSPGHTGSWAEAYPEIVTCANMFWWPAGSEWEDRLASEPGTGHLNPLKPKTYQVLKKVIQDVATLFPEPFFHAGADEIIPGCWKADPDIKSYLSNGGTLNQLLETFVNSTFPYLLSLNRTVVYWEDVLLDANIKVRPTVLPREHTILQTWNNGHNNTKRIVSSGYRTIVSSADFYYLDCGHGEFLGNDSQYDQQTGDNTGDGGSWCGPFKTWQTIYNYDITYGLSEEEAKLVLGGEVALWSEQADPTVLDARIWPRTSAMAETLWSGNRDDKTGLKRYAEATDRLNEWRYRMLGRGIGAEPLQPLWCIRNPWATWDELLLGFAVKRHGLQDWDSVVTELRTKSSLPRLLLTAHHCKLKFQDLKRRFSALYDSIFENRTPERDITIPWLDELRKLRVAELKQEVRNCDVSIQFLETKVKTLEEERDLSVRDDGISEGQRDLDEQPERSENDKGDEPERTTGDSDRENHSVNESNTTGSKGKSSREEGIVGLEPDPTGSRGPGSVPAPERSDDGSSGSVAKSESETDFGTDSAARGNSEVQSSASLSGTRKRKGRQRTELPNRGGPSQGLEVSVKSQPFVRVLEMIRGHRNGSMFERRFESQESEEYETLVKQHVDLETVQSRLDSGTYASCTLAFYRDLLLLFNNATLFFPNSSPESITAYQLRHLVLNEIPEGNNLYPKESSSIPNAASPSQPKPELERPQSLLAKHNSSAPILVCRKRSSISGRPNSSVAASGQKDNEATDDKKPALDPNSQPPKPSSDDSLLTTNAKEKPVTRVRSLRRSNKNPTENDTTSGSSKKQTDTSSGSKPRLIQKLGTPKTEKKKKAEAVTSEKKGSAADFLKRIKRNSPREKLKGSSSKEERRHKGKGGDRKEGRVLRQSGNKKPVKEEISSPSKRSVGRPPRKAAEAPAVSVKRGKEASASKRPRKRARRGPNLKSCVEVDASAI